ncbi:TRAP transporter small permease [Actinophytocola gossypii]|uniref:TRAP transporter small permease n=1 Tax=Actinophytocola gossypii TaxID=2812003 RepID=A0ABT2J1X7_9PSEU|nr:TRAP transporter small permease [Actinophytocola gossypii]MCT2581849.1 TRAP transporter small permease [Actinophytocola gossypii]
MSDEKQTPRGGFEDDEATFTGWVNRTLGTFVAAALGGITLVLLLQVLMRYAFRSPFVWADEVTRILMVWLTFVGAALAYRTRSHIGITTVLDAVRRRGGHRRAAVMNVVIQAVVVVSCAALLIGGVIVLVATAGHLTPALELPMAVLFLPAPLSGAIVLASAVAEWFGRSGAERSAS